MKMAAIFNSLALIIYIIFSIIIIGYAYLYILILQASGKIGANSSQFYTIKIVHIILFLPRLQRNAGEDFFIINNQIIKKLGE